MEVFSDVWYQVLRHVKNEIRVPVSIFISLFQPVLWLLVFSQMFKATFERGGIEYLQFFAPAVIIMTVIFGSTWSGTGLLTDIDKGVLAKTLATPVTRISIILARVTGTVIMVLIPVLIIFLLALWMGLDIVSGIAGVLYSLFVVILLTAGFAAFSNGLALLLRRQESLLGVINFIALPLLFSTSSFVPPSALPGWLNTARQLNPVDYSIVAVRSIVNDGWVWSTQWKPLAVLGLWVTAGLIFAVLMFRKYKA